MYVCAYVLIGQVHFILQNGCNDLQETLVAQL